MNNRPIIIIGKSGSGKNTVCDILVKEYGFIKVVETTTREIRDNEVEGVDYFYVSDDEYNKLRTNNMLATNTKFNRIQCLDTDIVSYGITKDQIEDNIRPLIITNPLAMKQLRMTYPNAIVVYLDIDDISRAKKLVKRGDDFDEVIRRQRSDFTDFRHDIISEVDITIINDDYLLTPHEVAQYIIDSIRELYVIEKNCPI